jgi:hypothetical protein
LIQGQCLGQQLWDWERAVRNSGILLQIQRSSLWLPDDPGDSWTWNRKSGRLRGIHSQA